MTQDEIIRMARDNCPYTKELLRGAYYDGFVKAANLIASNVYTKNYNPDVKFNDDGTFSLTLPDGDELRIIPPQQESTAEVSEEGYAWGKNGILPDGTLLYTHPVRTKDLTDDEIAMCMGKDLWNVYKNEIEFARAVIAADREKNK